MRNIFYLFTAAIFCSTDYSFAQDIGLFVDDSAYINLTEKQSTSEGDDGIDYSGWVTTFDDTRGFLHSPINAHLDPSTYNMAMDALGPSRFSRLSGDFIRRKIDSNTVYEAVQNCNGECPRYLIGTTYKKDLGASSLLAKYEINKLRTSLQISDYLSLKHATNAACKDGLNNYCLNEKSVGFVVPQSQVGAVNLVARSSNAPVEVATFVSDGFEGALVLTSPEVATKVSKATDYTLTTNGLDFSKWEIVDKSFNDTPNGYHKINLEFNNKGGFFSNIYKQRNDVAAINEEMEPFFKQLPLTELGCKYRLNGFDPILDCFFHSDALPINIDPVWIRAHSSLVVVEKESSSEVSVGIVFSKKYNKLDDVPKPSLFGEIKYSDLNEALLAKATVGLLADAFQNYFQSAVKIRR